MTDTLKRSIFVTFPDGGTFQYTKYPYVQRWMLAITPPSGERWIYPGDVTREHIEQAMRDAARVDQYD